MHTHSGLERESIAALQPKLKGTAIGRGDSGYDEARFSWNLTINHRPDVIVVAESENDVVEAICFASEHDLPVAVQATGHGQPRICDGGLLLIVGKLCDVVIDRDAKTATVGGGTKWEQVIGPAVDAGLLPVSGSAPHVGVVGYLIGGGYGILSRTLGLGCDSVLAFRIVTPDGQLRQASPTENPDLFWAVLGGGGAYGVVTSVTLELHDHGPLFGGSVMFDASLAPEVYAAWVRWTKTLPDDVSAAITLMTFPPVPFIPEFLHGRSMVIVGAGALLETGRAEELLAPIRQMPGAEFDSFRPMSYRESGDIFRDPVDPLPVNGRGVLLSDLDEAGARRLVEAIGPPAQSPNLMIQMRHLGGAIQRPQNGTSVGDRRRAQYLLYMLGVPMGPITPEMMASHAEGVFEKIHDLILCRGPLNFLGEARIRKDEVRDVFSDDEYAKLCSVKASVDPTNRFPFAGVGLRD